MDSESRNWGDPKVYDAPLTARGDKQAQSLRLDLAEACAKREKQFGDALWVTSPLTRAMQTFLTACPYQSRLQRAANGANASTSAAGGHVSERPLRMVVLRYAAQSWSGSVLQLVSGLLVEACFGMVTMQDIIYCHDNAQCNT